MAPLILHVEDDLVLRTIVEMTLQNLGFRGETVFATTIAQGWQVLEHAAQGARVFDLIISDMHLPDGTGLELVRRIRASTTWRTTPTLILSSDLSPNMVGRAYALGANAYIDKSPGGRSTSEVIGTLYKHWLTDVVSPDSARRDHAHDVTGRAMQIRRRFADIYIRLADRFGDDTEESAFWLSRALGESNLMNLLAFVQTQIDVRVLDATIIEDINRMQQETDGGLDRLEGDFASLSRDELYVRIADVLAVTDVNIVARVTAEMFPARPAALVAVRDFLIAAMVNVSSWIDVHTTSSAAHDGAARLREATIVHDAS